MSIKRVLYSGFIALIFIYVSIISMYNHAYIRWIWVAVATFSIIEFLNNLMKYIKNKNVNSN